MGKRRWTEVDTGTWGMPPGGVGAPGLDPDRVLATHGRLTQLDELRDMMSHEARPPEQGERVFVREVMRPPQPTARQTTALSEVMDRLYGAAADALPVVDDEGRVIGLVVRDAAAQALERAPSERPLTAADVMTVEVPACYPDMRILSLLDVMRGLRLATVPVVDRDGQLVGTVALDDVAALGLYDDQVRRVRQSLHGPGAAGRLRAWLSRR